MAHMTVMEQVNASIVRFPMLHETFATLIAAHRFEDARLLLSEAAELERQDLAAIRVTGLPFVHPEDGEQDFFRECFESNG